MNRDGPKGVGLGPGLTPALAVTGLRIAFAKGIRKSHPAHVLALCPARLSAFPSTPPNPTSLGRPVSPGPRGGSFHATPRAISVGSAGPAVIRSLLGYGPPFTAAGFRPVSPGCLSCGGGGASGVCLSCPATLRSNSPDLMASPRAYITVNRLSGAFVPAS